MSQPIKILHVVHSLGVGGLENGVVNLINALDGDRFAHVICCLTRSGKLAERLDQKTVEVIELGLCAEKFRFPILKLRRLFCQLQPEILHTRGWSTVDAIPAGKISGIRHLIHGEHGREASDPAGCNGKRNFIRKCLSPMVDRFVTVSDDLKTWLTQTVGISEEKVVAIHNGVDVQKFAPLRGEGAAGSWQRAEGRRSVVCPRSSVRSTAQLAESKEQGADSSEQFSALSAQPSVLTPEQSAVSSQWSAVSSQALRRALCLPQDVVVIGTVGRLDPVKDHPNLLRAFASLSQWDEAARLIIVGDGPMRKEIESEVHELNVVDKVKLLGERKDIADILRAVDIFALTSIAEGISNTILEAMATGLPVVATRVGGNPELVRHGVTGQLVPSGDVAALKSALASYARDPELRGVHGKAARQRAVEKFSLERMAAEYEKLYAEVAGRQDYGPRTTKKGSSRQQAGSR